LKRLQTLPLEDGAAVAVIGGGPAGAFFAIHAARMARALGRRLRLTIIEKNGLERPGCPAPFMESCNFCAGGISPNLFDILARNGIQIPPEIIEGRARSITIHGDWKSIELRIPEGRTMLTVFRGSRPKDRPSRYVNFDAFLLDRALREGAQLIAGDVQDIGLSPAGKPLLTYRRKDSPPGEVETMEADFVALATGVNPVPGRDPGSDGFVRGLRRILPDFRPPRVRRSLICEMEAQDVSLERMKTEIHFAQYGSRALRIEMSSLIPKGRWMTVVLLGPSVDRAGPMDRQAIIKGFLALPHIKRLLPRNAEFRPACLCFPNMTTGRARGFVGDRVALIGDGVVSRLYKDGIYSAYKTAEALSDCLFRFGVDKVSLKKGYQPTVLRFDRDNLFGRIVFSLIRGTFSRPLLSRVAYQAVLTELKTKPKDKRRLTEVLWKIASGDDSYRQILAGMAHPAALWTILWGGAFLTVRNMITEGVFGLAWSGFGRYQTGVAREDMGDKRRAFEEGLEIPVRSRRPEFERLYSIKIKADPPRILREIGKLGDADRRYFRPRLVRLRRTSGAPNEPKSTIRYDITPKFLSFDLVLEKTVGESFLLYRVRDGFARGGLLIFDVENTEDGCTLSIYVAFDFYRGHNFAGWLRGGVLRLLFPAFVHDVIWNHSLCLLKHLIEVGPDDAETASDGSL
jgi:flavin-dependent dehydrogenase